MMADGGNRDEGLEKESKARKRLLLSVSDAVDDARGLRREEVARESKVSKRGTTKKPAMM
jgi:hypothetical protein